MRRLGGVTDRLATHNATRSPKRTARTASALMVGVGLVAFVTVFGASLKTSFSGSLDADFHGTHVVDSGVFDSRGGISPRLAATWKHRTAWTSSPRRESGRPRSPASPGMFQAFTAATIGEVFELGGGRGRPLRPWR